MLARNDADVSEKHENENIVSRKPQWHKAAIGIIKEVPKSTGRW
jgi:hypothetical protein